MGGDLGTVDREVHAQAAQLLDFWFELLMPELHFVALDGVDEAIRARFALLRDRIVETGAERWRDDPQTLLAAVIAIDQFSRNLFRGQAEAFAADSLARSLTLLAIERGWDRTMPAKHRQFLYMPLMHAEDGDIQRLSIEKFRALGDPETLDYACQHAAVIERFGRFPTRNAALGRASTPEEQAYLSQPDVGW